MKNQVLSPRVLLIAGIIVLAAASRLLMIPNFTAIGAMALFGGALLTNRSLALVLPLVAMWLSDLFLNNVTYAQPGQSFVFFYEGWYWQYLPIALTAIIGKLMIRKVSIGNIAGASFVSSVFFFVVSNFGVWASSAMYAKTFAGLMDCYVKGIPFFGYTLLGTIFFSGIFFGGFMLAERNVPALAKVKVKK